MKHKKIFCFFLCMIMFTLLAGCAKKSLVNNEHLNEDKSESNTEDGVEDNNSTVSDDMDIDLDSFKSGKWTERECSLTNINSASSDNVCDAQLTINVYEDLNEDEVMAILNYYWDKEFDGGKNFNDYEINSCYAVFYQNDTCDVIEKIKFSDGNKQDVTQEDEYKFDSIISSDKLDKAYSDNTQ